MACRVHQAIQRENEPVRSPEPFGRSTVCLPDSLNISMTHSIHCYKDVFFFLRCAFIKLPQMHNSATFESRAEETRLQMAQCTTTARTRVTAVCLWRCRESRRWSPGTHPSRTQCSNTWRRILILTWESSDDSHVEPTESESLSPNMKLQVKVFHPSVQATTETAESLGENWRRTQTRKNNQF